MMKHLEVAPLPPIDAGPDEDAWQEQIADVLRVATFNHDRDLEQFLVRMRLWSPEEIPELLKELTLERQRARARSRTS